MFKKYFIFNETMGNPCFDGRRFWTQRGAIRFAMRNLYIKINGKPVILLIGEYSIRRWE